MLSQDQNEIPKMTVDSQGNRIWNIKIGSRFKLHRIDGPAVEYIDGAKEWYRCGKHHRIDGPAVERKDGSYEWCYNGIPHRVDGPAIEQVTGEKHWFVEGDHPEHDLPGMTIVFKDILRDYILIYEFASQKYYAGCRHFTYEEAIEHWSNPGHRESEIVGKYVEAIKKHHASLKG